LQHTHWDSHPNIHTLVAHPFHPFALVPFHPSVFYQSLTTTYPHAIMIFLAESTPHGAHLVLMASPIPSPPWSLSLGLDPRRLLPLFFPPLHHLHSSYGLVFRYHDFPGGEHSPWCPPSFAGFPHTHKHTPWGLQHGLDPDTYFPFSLSTIPPLHSPPPVGLFSLTNLSAPLRPHPSHFPAVHLHPALPPAPPFRSYRPLVTCCQTQARTPRTAFHSYHPSSTWVSLSSTPYSPSFCSPLQVSISLTAKGANHCDPLDESICHPVHSSCPYHSPAHTRILRPFS